MKKIIFILILTISSVYAKPCMTDIYFGNGVWNTEKEAIEGRDALRLLMFSIPSSRLNVSLEGQEYTYKHAYNPTGGTKDDLIETFYQLKESGQITSGYFIGVYAALAAESNGEVFINKLRDIISKYNSDVNTMFTKYKNESFDKKHNVLLVAHSQGNLFGNKMYTLMSDAQKEKFRMVSVATPANHVAGGGPYVTASGDYVIVPIPGSLPANVIGFGHTFIGTYLNMDGVGVIGDGSNSAPPLIVSFVKSAYDNLMQTTSCSEYSFINILMFSFGNIQIFGRPLNQATGSEFIAELTLEQYDATYDANRKILKCNGDNPTMYFNNGGSIGSNWTSGTYNDKSGKEYLGRYEWVPTGYIDSNTKLQASISAKEELMMDQKCLLLSLEPNSSLYTAIEAIFPKE